MLRRDHAYGLYRRRLGRAVFRPASEAFACGARRSPSSSAIILTTPFGWGVFSDTMMQAMRIADAKGADEIEGASITGMTSSLPLKVEQVRLAVENIRYGPREGGAQPKA